MSRTCDGLRAVNVGGGGAEVLSGGRRRRRSAFRRAFGALIARGSGRGLPKALMGGREIFRRLFLSTSRRFFLRAAKASFSAARNQNAWGLPRGVRWVVRGLCARALCLRGCLRNCAGIDRSDMPLL